MAVTLRELTDVNREAVLALHVMPEQERFVGGCYGSEAVREVVELVRAEGAIELLTSFVLGDVGPAGFYERLGFVPTGDLDVNKEVILRLALL